MIIKEIKLKNFRNIKEASLIFPRETTVFNGANAQGKTNMLEAIYMPVTGRSFRTSHENEFIKYDENVCELEEVWNDGTRDKTVTFRWVKSGYNILRFCSVNKVPVPKLSELYGTFRAVLFCPEDLGIVKDGPSERRKFLDMAIARTSTKYLKSLQKYGSILNQRNNLLKQLRFSPINKVEDEISPWNELLSEEAEKISAERFEYVGLLSTSVNKIVKDMTKGYEDAVISYHQPKSKDDYLKMLSENLSVELKAGMTLYGPHRDDLSVMLNGREARVYCSQGQQRTVALALKTAEGELIFDKTGDYPVYLYDDILSELDEYRRSYLLDGIKDKQVFITSCDKIETSSAVFKVQNGEYSVV